MLQHKLINWLLFIFLCLVWGSSFIIMKRSAETLSGWQIGAIRIFSAGLFFLPLAVFHLRSVPLKKIPLVILSGVLGNLFPAFLFAIAIEKKINSSLAGILNSLTPLLVIVLGILLFKEKLQRKKMAGVVVGFVGLIILSLSKGAVTVDNFGFTLLVLLATLCYALNVNMVSHYLQGVDPMKIATVSLAFMMIPAGVIAWQQNVFSIVRYDEAAQMPIAAIVLLGIVGSAIATAIFYFLIKRAGGLFASLVTYGIPVISIFWGMMDGENVTAIQMSCLAMILGGVYLANK
ncbi:MAG: DMT family transporter [Bacteroidota bacterium]